MLSNEYLELINKLLYSACDDTAICFVAEECSGQFKFNNCICVCGIISKMLSFLYLDLYVLGDDAWIS